MLNYARSKKDFTHIATGHYARIKKSSYAEKINLNVLVGLSSFFKGIRVPFTG